MNKLTRSLPLISAVIITMVTSLLIALGTSSVSFADSEKVGRKATYADEVRSKTPFASKIGCADPRLVVGNPLNRDIYAIGVHSWEIRVTAQDCDGYDIVSKYVIRLDKENGRCSNGGAYLVNNYDFNPNSLGYWNPGTTTLDCTSGQVVYTVTYGANLRINSNDPENERCLGAKVQVDKGPLLTDFNGVVPSVCFNGI